MEIVTDVVGEYVYTMLFNHTLIAPLNVTHLGFNVNQERPHSTLAALYQMAYRECQEHTETDGVIDYSKLLNARNVTATLLYVRANECLQMKS